MLRSETGIESPSTRRALRGPRSGHPIGTAAELGAGALLLGAAAVAGLLFVRRPWPNRLDAWGDRVLPADLNAPWAHAFVGLGSMTALLGGVLVVFLIGLLRDRVRAVAVAMAPVLAVLIVQDIAKPLVDRHNALVWRTLLPVRHGGRRGRPGHRVDVGHAGAVATPRRAARVPGHCGHQCCRGRVAVALSD